MKNKNLLANPGSLNMFVITIREKRPCKTCFELKI